jgi:hypothetical protein
MAGAGRQSTSSQIVPKQGMGARAKPNHDGGVLKPKNQPSSIDLYASSA